MDIRTSASIAFALFLLVVLVMRRLMLSRFLAEDSSPKEHTRALRKVVAASIVAATGFMFGLCGVSFLVTFMDRGRVSDDWYADIIFYAVCGVVAFTLILFAASKNKKFFQVLRDAPIHF